ncbi:MAG: type II toxin-antitoxin system VapC family toxin [Thermoproteota archaeon]
MLKRCENGETSPDSGVRFLRCGKVVQQRSGSDEAIELMESHVEGSTRLYISELVFYEVANALRYKPDYDADRLKNAISQVFRLHLNVASLDEHILNKATTIAYDVDVTLYKAVPVALAEDHKTSCITADEETQYGKLNMKGYPIELL